MPDQKNPNLMVATRYALSGADPDNGAQIEDV